MGGLAAVYWFSSRLGTTAFLALCWVCAFTLPVGYSKKQAEVDGLVALEARKAAPGWWTRLLGGAPTNRVEYANELEPRVGALRACAADGGCADPRECGGLCAATLEPHKEEAEEIEDADE